MLFRGRTYLSLVTFLRQSNVLLGQLTLRGSDLVACLMLFEFKVMIFQVVLRSVASHLFWHTRQLFKHYSTSSFQRCLRILSHLSCFQVNYYWVLLCRQQEQESQNLASFYLSTVFQNLTDILSDTIFLYPMDLDLSLLLSLCYRKKTNNVLHYNDWATWSCFLVGPTQFSLLQYIWKKLQLMERSLLKLESWTS